VVAEFIDSHKGRFGVEPVCRVLKAHGVKIAPSTYYAHKKRPASARALRDAHLSELVEMVFFDPAKGRGVAGVRKVWHYLLRDGHQVAQCTVERLMRELGLKGVRRDGKRVITTKPDDTATRSPDLVDRNFTAFKPNQLWVVDFTYVPTWEGTCFTAFVQDVYSRRITGWRVARSMPTELPLDALEMALWVRRQAGQDPRGVIHHSDAGSQYTAIRYVRRLQQVGVVASIGTVGDSYDNAMAESINGLYKAECVKLEGPWQTCDQLELATCNWVYYWNNHRLHSAIGYRTPCETEADYHDHQTPRPNPVSR
jgi:putative transposase